MRCVSNPSAFLLVAGSGLLAACNPAARTDNNQQEVSAEGKAQVGKISIKAPGVDLSIAAPKELTGTVRAGRDSKVVYPGSVIEGVAIAASETKGKGGDTDVESRFQTSDPLDRVLAWYRDPARAEDFHLETAAREKDDVLLTGNLVHEPHPFRVRLKARHGGTEGRLIVHHDD